MRREQDLISYLIRGATITDAWLNALVYLRSVGREQFDLVVAVENAAPSDANPNVIATLDRLLARIDHQTVRTVANTIFPAQLGRTSLSLDRLISRYLEIYPKIRSQHGNSKGTYFGRIVSYSLREEGGSPVNQLKLLIDDLRTEVKHRDHSTGTKRHLFEVQIFAPGRDRRPMGFPCMSSLSFHIDRDRLRLTAIYRNQYYIERALGNFLGLAELQKYVADQVGLCQGPLIIHACHAEIEHGVRLGEVDPLIERCGDLATARPAEARLG